MGQVLISDLTEITSLSGSDLVEIETSAGLSRKATLTNMASILGDYSPRIDGFIVSNNLSDITNDLNISIGTCWDSTKTKLIRLTSPLVKQLNATWAAGTNAGMMQSGQTMAAAKSYRLYAIASSDLVTVDIIATEYNVALVLPTGYTYYRYIFSFRTITASATIQLFEHLGNETLIHSDKTVTTGARSAGTFTLSYGKIPLGLTRPIVSTMLAHGITVADDTTIYSILPDGSFSLALTCSGMSYGGATGMLGYVILNSSYQYRLVQGVTNGNTTIYAMSYIDRDREAF